MLGHKMEREDHGWISGFLLSNCVLMIWLLFILPINCPMQQNRPRESGTSSQQGRAIYRIEIPNLIILQARFSADVNIHSLTEVTGSILTSFRQGAGYLHESCRKKPLFIHCARAGKSHTPTGLSHFMPVSQSSELIWGNTIRESVIAAKGSVIHHLQNKGSQH